MLKMRHPLALFVISLLVMVGVLQSFSTPEPVGADAPDTVFSAVRAGAILDDLLQEGVPHVAGSPANEVVGDRIIARLESYGYSPQIQSEFHCNPMFGSCSPVRNIMAVKPGVDGKAAVLLTAHYDSGWAGPGAADDGAGTAAVLEIARMMADFPAFDNNVIFLFSDSEENGLIGADAFADGHALFPQVKAVINLEARGTTGPSALFETGEGNRGLIRVFSKNVERPVGNSLVYEIYKRMPNDTDYTVYKRKGVMGANFAFAQGAPVYHSVIDDTDHLSPGSLQHHGDNAWSMLQGLGDRDLTARRGVEDAGYIDVFGSRLIHYPVSITGGLALVLGVWVMLAIGVSFRREFRFRQLRWGLLAVPFMLFGLLFGGYLLTWPLGVWPELHPLEHPYPWPGRLALFSMFGLVVYSTVKLFNGRVSACSWMMIAWAMIFILGIVLTNRLPTAAHIALLPLALFGIGSVFDLLRKKSPAPLLIATTLGFAAAAFISFYHFFMLDVVMNFDQSHIKMIAFWLMGLAVMPMLLAFSVQRELTWRPAKILLFAVLILSVTQYFVPGFTEDRPRDMTLKYSEVEGEATGYLVLESIYRTHDRDYANGHNFRELEINSGRLGTVLRPVREIAPLGLPGIAVSDITLDQTGQGWRRQFRIDVPPDSRRLRLTFPEEAGLTQAWVNGELALDTSIPSKHEYVNRTLTLVYPGEGPLNVELLTESEQALTMAAITWYDLPENLVAPFMSNWPSDAKPFLYGPRAEIIQEITLGGGLLGL